MEDREEKLTVAERENLMTPSSPHYSGFTPRPIQQLTARRKPHSLVDIECCHFLRTPTRAFTSQQPSVEHRLWIEAGKHPAPFPARPDTSYNSNIWRNFRRNYGLQFSAEGQKVTDVIAAMYPLNIPAPSNVGDNTFEKYIRETRLFQDEKAKTLALRRTRTEIHEFKQLRCKTDARNPPLSEKGDILPPENFKKYAHQFVPFPSPPPTPPPPGQKTDMFGQRYTPRSKPLLWKLSYKLNHPEYQRLREEVKKRREMMEAMKKEKESNHISQVMPSPLLSATPPI